MIDRRFDVVVVGSGPAGSTAAVVLARGGARVALVDKASFPREKACGDLIGPRGVQTLRDLELDLPGAARVSDMIVVGPTGNRVRLPAAPGRTYPGHGIVVERSAFDAHLQRAAILAGAELVDARVDTPIAEDGRVAGFEVSSTRLRADIIIGADGATSRVAEVAGLVDPRRVLWGFAVRTYVDEPVEEPHILLWTPVRGEAFPGYGWVFPAGSGRANVGLGIGVLADRSAARRATRDLAAFVEHARRLGVLGECGRTRPPTRPLGAWRKMGLVGTAPARGRVLLVGDAAGLVNPLQGEGIAQAMDSGRAAAQAILGGLDRATGDYRAHLAHTHGAYLSTAASAHRSLLRRPKLVAPFTRSLTAPAVGRPLAGAWSITWNDLLDGAPRSRATAAATAVAELGRVLTARSADRRWIREHLEVP
jgi:geranylgeranyl reductase family protein